MEMEMEMEKMEMEMEMFGMSPTGLAATASEDEGDLRRGPWTAEEDMLLVDYIAKHGEGRWNSLARCAGLKRTGKSCRLRWLNYLRPGVRRGNITPEEQLLILELHSRWGNRWSKIAQRLPGRTDNEIKNYWRTRVQKHAKQLKCDVNSKQFRDVVRYIWMPRLVERIQAGSATAATGDVTASLPVTRTMSSPGAHLSAYQNAVPNKANHCMSSSEPNPPMVTMSPDTSSTLRSSLTEGSHAAHFTPVIEGAVVVQDGGESGSMGDDVIHSSDVFGGSWSELLATTGLPDFEFGDPDDSLWSLEDIFLQQHY